MLPSAHAQLTEYYEVIQHPMALDLLKGRLQAAASHPYEALEDVVRDIRLIFKNCYEFNPVSYNVMKRN